jgi:replication-associated recombination protein RarA
MASGVEGWNFEFRPKEWDECILAARLRKFFARMEKEEILPNMLFVGPPGIGKLMVAVRLCDRRGHLLTQVTPKRKHHVGWYETSTPWGSEKQVVGYVFEWQLANLELQDEISHWMELGYAVAFIVGTADESKVTLRLKSRLLKIDFRPQPDDIGDLKQQARLRCRQIFTQAKVEATDEEIARIVDETFPDFRTMINELYRLSLQKAA